MDFLYWENFQDLVVPKLGIKGMVQSGAILRDNFFIATEGSLIWVNKKTIVNKPVKFVPPVTQIACNFSVVLLLAEGSVWAIGIDEGRNGLLATDGLYKSDQPVQISSFSNKILKISIGPTHAACIDDQGSLYTWGSGQHGELGDLSLTFSKPQQVTNSNFFKSVDVACGLKSTSVCTEAGFLFIFGKRLNCASCTKSTSYPATIRSLSDDYITKVISISENILVQTDKQEIKIISNCYCTQTVRCKGKILEFVSFDNGAVGLSPDKRIIYVIKYIKGEWTCENFLVSTGNIIKIVNGVDKFVGIIGKGMNAKSLKKVNEVCSEDSSLSTGERISFDEIVQSFGLKGKIFAMDQREIFSCIEKVALRYYAEVFGCLKSCKKRRGSVIFALRSRFEIKSVENWWNMWKSVCFGHKQAQIVYNAKLRKLQSGLLKAILSNLYKSSVKNIFSRIFNRRPSLVPRRSALLFSLLKSFKVKSRNLAVFQAFRAFHKNTKKQFPRPKPLFIDPSYKIEILPPDEDKEVDRTSTPLHSHSFLSDNDGSIKKFCSSLMDGSIKSPGSEKFSSSMKILNSTSSPLIDTPSSNSETSPFLKLTKDDYSLKSQLFKKIAEKKNNDSGIKHGALGGVKGIINRKPAVDKKKHLSNKEPETPKLLKRTSFDMFPKRNSTSGIQKIFPGEYVREMLKQLMNKCIKRKLLDIIERIKRESRGLPGKGSKSVGYCGSPKTLAIAGSWKNKLLALGVNKFLKSLSGLIKKNEESVFNLIKKVQRLS